MANRSAVMISLNSQNFQVEISSHAGDQAGFSQLQQNQRPPENQNLVSVQLNNNVSSDIAVDMPVSENTSEDEGNQPPETGRRQTSQTNITSLAELQQFLQQNPELYNFLKAAVSYVPFLLLVLIKEVFKHSTEILVTLALVGMFVYSDIKLVQEVSKQAKRGLKPLLVLGLNITFFLWAVNYVCGTKVLFYHTFLVFPEETGSFSLTNLIWTVIATDHVLKLLTVLIKIVICAIPIRLYAASLRGKWYVFVERTSQLYRAVAAIPPWIHYLFSASTNQESASSVYSLLLGILLCAVYFVCKVYKAVGLLKKWKVASVELLRSTRYGVAPDREQLQVSGPMCPICHDGYKIPTMLPCKHIFCEECLALWLDRERTCPMCRSTVAEDPRGRDGRTTYFFQLF